MTFTALKPRAQRRSDPVCVALQRRYSHERHRVYIEFTFSAKLCADLKWKVGDWIEVAVGEGQDRGYVRFKPSDSGYVLKAGNASRPRICFTYWGADETKFAQAPAQFRPDPIGRTLTVELPWQPRIVRAA